MVQRIVAIVGAVGLVALAVFARGVLHDDGAGGPQSTKDDSGPPGVACTPDLAEVCTALADGGAIARRPTLDLKGAADPPPAVDGWLTWDPAPQLVNLDLPDSEPWARRVAVAGADLAVLSAPEAREALANACNTLDWACIAENASDELPVGIGALDTAEGLARIAPLAPHLHRDDPTDVRGELLRALTEGPARGQADAVSMVNQIQTQPGALGVVIGPEPLLERAQTSPQGQGQGLKVAVPDPAATIAAVLVARPGRQLPGVVDAMGSPVVTAALEDVGLVAGSPRLATEDRIGELFQIRQSA